MDQYPAMLGSSSSGGDGDGGSSAKARSKRVVLLCCRYDRCKVEAPDPIGILGYAVATPELDRCRGRISCRGHNQA